MELAEGEAGGPPQAEDFVVDRAIILAIGGERKIVTVKRHGNSTWSSTARMSVQNADQTLHDYFVKIVKGDSAGPRVLGEYSCMSELYKTMPSIVPAPRGQGKCLDSEAHFFLCDYLEIDHRAPDPVVLGKKIAELHLISKSPTGKFGFHVPPYDGKLPLVADWDISWPSFYRKLLAGVHQLDTGVNGPWKDYDDAMRVVLDQVVPRLLGPLEEDGRSVKPCLIHGDLWEENIGTDPKTGDIYIFDSCAYYAHHEMAIGMWRVDHHHMKAKEYRIEYFKNFEPDEPVEQYDDRNRLYCIKEKVMYSAHVPGTKAREQALEDMLWLIEKYVNNWEMKYIQEPELTYKMIPTGLSGNICA